MLYNVGLKTLMQQGVSEAVFCYEELVHKFNSKESLECFLFMIKTQLESNVIKEWAIYYMVSMRRSHTWLTTSHGL